MGRNQARNQGGTKPPLEKCVGHSLKILDIVQKIWVPLGKLFASPGVQAGYGPGRDPNMGGKESKTVSNTFFWSRRRSKPGLYISTVTTACLCLSVVQVLEKRVDC